jgi:hypothetical protein
MSEGNRPVENEKGKNDSVAFQNVYKDTQNHQWQTRHQLRRRRPPLTRTRFFGRLFQLGSG